MATFEGTFQETTPANGTYFPSFEPMPLAINATEEFTIKIKCPLHGDIDIKVKPVPGGEVITGIGCPFPHPSAVNITITDLSGRSTGLKVL